MGGMLFNIKPHINLLRSVIHFFNGKRGKPLDLFPAFVPETITVPNGFKPNKSSQKGYPMYNYMTKDGFPRSLRTYHPTQYRIFCKETSSNISHQLENLHSEIKPLAIALSEGSKGQKTSDETLVCMPRGVRIWPCTKNYLKTQATYLWALVIQCLEHIKLARNKK